MTPDFVPVVLAAIALTMVTRFGGYIALSRVKRMPPRVAAALEAVPAAVMTTLFAPAIFSGGWPEAGALALAGLLALRFNATLAVAVGAAALIAVRALA